MCARSGFTEPAVFASWSVGRVRPWRRCGLASDSTRAFAGITNALLTLGDSICAVFRAPHDPLFPCVLVSPVAGHGIGHGAGTAAGARASAGPGVLRAKHQLSSR